MENKRLDYDLSNMSARERKQIIGHLMREEVTREGTDFFTIPSHKVKSKEKDVGLDIPIMELLDPDDIEGIPFKRSDSKIWILREPMENGKTIMFPMRPAQFIHQLQRQPLKVFVLSTSGMMSTGQLELSGLTEAVVRASKGPPYPISSMERFQMVTTGDFSAKVVGNVRVIAIGPQNVAPIKCQDNVNDQEQGPPPTRWSTKRYRPPIIVQNMDSQNKPSILTGPQEFTLYDIVKNIRERKQKEKYKPEPKPAPKRYYVEDLVFNRAKNTVTRAPKKTYLSLRAEIDRYLVLNKSRPRRKGTTTEEESIGSAEESEEERSTVDEEGEEEQEIEVEDEENEGEEMTKRVEAVFQSLIHVYGQNWANYKTKTSPSSSASMANEHRPLKRDHSKNSSIWKRLGNTNPERKKY